MISVGTHRARPIHSDFSTSGTGKKQIVVTFAMEADPNDRIRWYGFFTEKTEQRTVESLMILGWDGVDLYEFSGGLPAGVDKTVELVIDEEVDQNGNPQLKVRWINEEGGLPMKNVLGDAEARAFGASMRAKVAAMRARKGIPARRPAAPSNSTSTLDPDDIPF